MHEPYGLSIHHGRCRFGEYVLALIIETPANMEAVGGALIKGKTTPLLTLGGDAEAQREAAEIVIDAQGEWRNTAQ